MIRKYSCGSCGEVTVKFTQYCLNCGNKMFKNQTTLDHEGVAERSDAK